MTGTRTPTDPLAAHYAEVVRCIETLVLRRVPKAWFLASPPPLSDDEVSTVAQGLAHAHTVAAARVAR